MGIAQIFAVVVVLLVSFGLSQCRRVKNRFDYNLLERSPLRFLSPNVAHDERINVAKNKSKLESYVEALYGDNLRFNRFNLSFVPDASFAVGNLENGSYTGMIGQIERNEVDVSGYFARPSGLATEKLHVGPVATALDLHVYSRAGIITKRVDITDVFFNFTQMAYFQFWTCAYLAACIMAFVLTWENRPFKILTYVRALDKAMWGIFQAVIDQENYNPRSWAGRVAWVHICFAITIIVLGYWRNLMKTDIVTIIPSQRVNELNDFFREEFSNVKSIIFKNFWFYEYLKNAQNHTPIKRLHDRMSKQNDMRSDDGIPNFIDSKDASFALLLKTMEHEIRENRAEHNILFVRQIMEQVIEPAICKYDAGISKNIHKSDKYIARDNVNFVMSKSLSKGAKRYIEFKLRAMTEFGLMDHYLRDVGDILSHQVFSNLTASQAQAEFLCARENAKDISGTVDVQLQPVQLRNGVYTATVLLVAAFGILGTEFFRKKYNISGRVIHQFIKLMVVKKWVVKRKKYKKRKLHIHDVVEVWRKKRKPKTKAEKIRRRFQFVVVEAYATFLRKVFSYTQVIPINI